MRIETLLEERCALCHRTQEDQEKRLCALEGAEQRRRGGALVLSGLMAAAAAAGALFAKFLPLGVGR